MPISNGKLIAKIKGMLQSNTNVIEYDSDYILQDIYLSIGTISCEPKGHINDVFTRGIRD